MRRKMMKLAIEEEKRERIERQRELEREKREAKKRQLNEERVRRAQDAREWRREVDAQKMLEKQEKERRRIERVRQSKLAAKQRIRSVRQDIYDFADERRRKIRAAKQLKARRDGGKLRGKALKVKAASQIQRAFSKWSRQRQREKRSEEPPPLPSHPNVEHYSPYEYSGKPNVSNLDWPEGAQSAEDFAWNVVMNAQNEAWGVRVGSDALLPSEDYKSIEPMTPADLHFKGTAVEDAFPLPPREALAAHARHLTVATPHIAGSSPQLSSPHLPKGACRHLRRKVARVAHLKTTGNSARL